MAANHSARTFLVIIALAAGLAPLAHADQEADVKRALIQRQQMSDDFALRLQQDQARARVAPGDFARQREMESLFLQQRQSLDRINQQQLLDMQTRGQTTSPVLPQYDTQRFERERQETLQKFGDETRGLDRQRTERERARSNERHTPTLDPPARWGPSLPGSP